ncbi:MAG: sulfatase-like hydrolase/transferase, partial [Planctomycetota bacterium]
MPDRPNILFLMTDQMQARVLDPDHPCRTPNLDRLAARGIRFRRAYTTNAICSPARAGIMTGLQPHNHGVLTVTHTVDDDQSCLRTEHPHFAQRLEAAGYRTGYFGKWHVERSHDLARFGWQTNGAPGSDLARAAAGRYGARTPPRFSLEYRLETPGYPGGRFYGVMDHRPEARPMGVTTSMALDWLDDALAGDAPWCAFVSVSEPHDPYVCGEEAYAQVDPDALPLPPNHGHESADRPGLYRKAARIFAPMTERNHREAAACYYASITEIDGQYGRILDRLADAGALENTVVVFTTDHGDCLGAHGLYCKNVGAYEEVYNIPLLVAGPGVAAGVVSEARVGSHDLCPTLCALAGAAPIDHPDSRSAAGLLADPAALEADWTAGYAEYFGGRILLTQRIV